MNAGIRNLAILSLKSMTFLSVLTVCLSAEARLNPRLEDGLAITHTRVLQTLSQRDSGIGVGLAYYLDPSGQSSPNLSNMNLSKLPAFQSIRDAIAREIEAFKAGTPKGETGVGVAFNNRLFDIRFLQDDRARFSLVGVINRMDKAFQDPATCGETRLIYRLAYSVQVNGDKAKTVSSRLPLTINLVLHAKSPMSKLTCQEIAKRWKNLKIDGMMVSAAANLIMGESGILAPELRDRSLIKQVEINLQLARTPAVVQPDFGGRAVYLLKVFKWNEASQNFIESYLDNQVDKTQAKAFYVWLFEKDFKRERLLALDQGTLQIPEKFLAKRAFSIAPGGLSRFENHPLFNTLKDEEIAQQLLEAGDLTNIKSVEGFKRRLTDTSCTGCHQTRAVGGFHFMGQDPYRFNEQDVLQPLYPGNSVVVPGSGHFFADLARRRTVLETFASGQTPDFSSGFASRPHEHLSDRDLSGKGILNGWGAHCYVGQDPSFANWTCASQFRCQQLHQSEMAKGMGVCISQKGQELGDPTETGKVVRTGNMDKYERLTKMTMPLGDEYVNSPQSATKGEKTGGFPGGSIRLNSCDSAKMSRHKESRCGALPAAANGFNDCLFKPDMTFKMCLDIYSKGVGLRSCSRENTCRDDYICVESLEFGLEDEGVCVPPYFTFQFRVDGHPIKF